jgi:hypothetical protein
VVLFHHDPDRTDDQVDALARAAADQSTVRVDVAREGVSVVLDAIVPGAVGE